MSERPNHIVRPGENYLGKLGGKAFNLMRLYSLGYRVPAFVVIPETSFQELVSNKQLGQDGIPEFDQMEIPPHWISGIIDALPSNATHFSVRSSYGREDSSQFSFAGQFRTRLYVTREGLAQAILDVWSSVLQPQVLEYQREHGIATSYFLSVIVQEMVTPDISGVAFSMHPITGHRRQQLINAVFGVGEGLVSGALSADQYLLEGDKVDMELAEKREKMVRDPNSDGGLVTMPLTEEERNLPTLSPHQVKEVGALLSSLRDTLGRHQDIEFCYAKGDCYLLQTRPITTVGALPDAGGQYIVWDNSNIIESYPGLTSPLTYSYILGLYERAYRQLMGLLGVSHREIERYADDFSRMLGLLKGRVYYNLRSWYRMIALLPGYSFNARFMEQMMGVKERFDLEDQQQLSRLGDLFRIFRMIRSILYNLWTLEGQKKRFMQTYEAMEAENDAIDPESLSPGEIVAIYRKQEKQMLKIWKAPLVNDFFAMIYFGVLKKMLTKAFGPDSNYHNDILIGSKAIITTQPAEWIAEMVEKIYGDPSLLDLFQKQEAHNILSTLQKESQYQNFYGKVDRYIQTFGDRMVGELKLETKTFKQEPQRFVEVLRSYIVQERRPQRGLESASGQELRNQARGEVFRHFQRRPLRYLLLRHVLKRTQHLVSGRENLRFFRTRAFGGARTVFMQLGKIFHREQLLDAPEDIFFLTKEEVFAFIEGTSPNYDLRSLSNMRKQQYQQFEAEPLQSERIRTHGIVYLGNNFQASEGAAPLEEGDLKGIGCCQGLVRGRVKVVSDPEEVYQTPGEILVTTSTDPGWVTIFPSISGLLVERGSLLSHAAIVSREMGLPCVVGIAGLTERLKTGDEVEMDGQTGIVRVLNNRTD